MTVRTIDGDSRQKIEVSSTSESASSAWAMLFPLCVFWFFFIPSCSDKPSVFHVYLDAAYDYRIQGVDYSQIIKPAK